MNSDRLSALWTDPDWPPAMAAPAWESLLGQARRARLLPRLALHLEARGRLEAVPPAPRRHLLASLPVAARQQQEVGWEIDRLRRALAPIGAPVLLLKGAAYLAAGLPPARGRLFSDIDLLVERGRLEETENALFAAGWIARERDPYTERYYREWMHELPPLRHVMRGSNVDLHHTITAPTSRFAVDGARLVEHALPLESQPGLFMLCPADMVLHSAAHLFQEGEFGHGLRDLLDMNDLVGHFGCTAGFWPELLARAEALGLQIPLAHALAQLARLFGSAPPASCAESVRRLDRRLLARPVMGWLLERALRPEHPSCRTPGARAALG